MREVRVPDPSRPLTSIPDARAKLAPGYAQILMGKDGLYGVVGAVPNDGSTRQQRRAAAREARG